MTWFAASLIVSIRPIIPDESPITVFENVILIEAENPKDAAAKARVFATEEPGADEGLTVNGKPARTTVEGIRKLVTVSNVWPHDQEIDRPTTGTEITYSKFELKNDQALLDIVAGKQVEITYVE